MINIHGKHANSHQWDFDYHVNSNSHSRAAGMDSIPLTWNRAGPRPWTALEMERCRWIPAGHCKKLPAPGVGELVKVEVFARLEGRRYPLGGAWLQ